MIEIAWRESDPDDGDWDEIAKKQWAFIIGFLTHMVTDQTIHPYIDKIAGQYYRNKESRTKHRSAKYTRMLYFSTTDSKKASTG